MQTRSYGSVKVVWLDQEQVKAEVKAAAHELARIKPEVVKVVLFGSLVRGDAVPGSDADVLVVLKESTRRFLDRDYSLTRVSIGVDVFPYTEAELEKMLSEGNPLICEALREGVIVYERLATAAAIRKRRRASRPVGEKT